MYRSFGASFVYITPRACRADICPVSRFANEGQTMRIPLQSATQEKCAGRTAERAYRPARAGQFQGLSALESLTA